MHPKLLKRLWNPQPPYHTNTIVDRGFKAPRGVYAPYKIKKKKTIVHLKKENRSESATASADPIPSTVRSGKPSARNLFSEASCTSCAALLRSTICSHSPQQQAISSLANAPLIAITAELHSWSKGWPHCAEESRRVAERCVVIYCTLSAPPSRASHLHSTSHRISTLDSPRATQRVGKARKWQILFLQQTSIVVDKCGQVNLLYLSSEVLV